MKKYILVALAIIWALLIFYASSKDYKESNKDSTLIIKNVVEKSAYITNKIGITNIDLSNKNINNIVKSLNKPIRKITHFIIYFILAVILYYMFISFGLPKKSILLVFLICFIYSITDEYHQSFSFGRTSSFKDCIIDTSGAICGCTLELIIYKIVKKYHLFQNRMTRENIN